MTLEQLSCF